MLLAERDGDPHDVIDGSQCLKMVVLLCWCGEEHALRDHVTVDGLLVDSVGPVLQMLKEGPYFAKNSPGALP